MLRRVVKPNWIAQLFSVLGPLVLLISLIVSLWMPIFMGIPTYVVGAVVALVALGVANFNTRIDTRYR